MPIPDTLTIITTMNNMKIRLILAVTAIMCACFAEAQYRELNYCYGQTCKTLQALDDTDKFPRSIAKGNNKWETVETGDWTSGFFPGILWYVYENNKDQYIKAKAELSTHLLGNLYKKGISHDIGFQTMCSYGNAYRITQNPQYKDILLRSAEAMKRLYNPKVGTILSWPWMVKEKGWQHNTIIDNMMNLELLFWASKNGGGKEFYDIAVSHAKKTKQNHFREDYSCYHVVLYDTVSGNFIKGITHQGYNDNSMWARGQAWAIYGYTMVYRETRDKEFLMFVRKLINTYVKRLPDDLIPYWDFDDPNIPNTVKDASAAAVVASALLELSTLEDNEKLSHKYYDYAVSMLKELSGSNYKCGNLSPAFLLHSTGHYPAGEEIDASLIYADYYYIEALTRWRKILEKQELYTGNKFIHPGILHTKESLALMKDRTDKRQSPFYDSFLLLKKDSCASKDYKIKGPFETIARLGKYSMTKRPSEDDHKAAYLNAVMWTITGDKAYAEKSIEILNSYSSSLKSIDSTDNDAPLCASLQGCTLANAAELIKHTYPEVNRQDVEQWENMFYKVFIPILETFFIAQPYTNGNWGAAATKAYLAFGIFLEDESLYNKAIDFFFNGNDNGTIKNYIAENGQCQESGRDQDHVMFGLGNMAEACETAYNQGNETLYSALDNRLMKGYEYTAKYNLGETVPYKTWTDISGRYCDWSKISEKFRGVFRPIYEIAFNHYVFRKGNDMPYTKRVISKTKFEGREKWCDGPGYGTLFFKEQP